MLDRYGRVYDGNEVDVLARLDTFLTKPDADAASPWIPRVLRGREAADGIGARRRCSERLMGQILLKAEIAIDLESLVDRRAVDHHLALDGDDDLRPGDQVALVNESVTVVTVVDEIDSEGFLHPSMR